MGVYIKGFEIAEDHACVVCRLSTKTAFDKLPFCDVTMKDIEDWSKRPDWCPIVPVPPHGRLIDADALINDMANMIPWAIESPEEIAMVDGLSAGYEAVKAALTIIPAEEGEEQREYEAQVEAAQYCEMYEPTYDPETGAL